LMSQTSGCRTHNAPEPAGGDGRRVTQNGLGSIERTP
jgi:hypothetical protein